MAGKPKYDYPPKKELLKLLKELGGQAAVADALGIPRPTLQHHLRKVGLKPSDWTTKKKLSVAAGQKVSKEEILQQRVKELEATLRKVRKNEVADERLIQVIENSAAAALPIFNTGSTKPPPPPGDGEHEMVLLWSDTHAGEVVSSSEINNLDRGYDWSIMWERHEQLLDKVLSYCEHRPYKVSRLHVLALGDMLSGNIHDELEATNEMPYAEAVADFGVEGAAWLKKLADAGGFSEIKFSGVVGNHPRAHRKPRAKGSFDNGDWLVYRWFAKLLEDDSRFSFNIPKSAQTIHEVCGRNILVFHGDSIRSSMPGLPLGGVVRRVNTLNATYDGNVDMFVCGHFHQPAFLSADAGHVVINGSIKGVDEYSLKAFGGGRPPQQLLLTFHPEHGLTDMSLLDLA